MSGFRKFRTTLHRRRRSIEAVELGYLTGGVKEPGVRADGVIPGTEGFQSAEPLVEGGTPLEFSVSAEVREIGPNPIVWLKPKRTESDN